MAKLIYGVFPVERCWKLYVSGEGVQTFATRQSALRAGAAAARLALAHDIEVDLYVQKKPGVLQKIEHAALGH